MILGRFCTFGSPSSSESLRITLFFLIADGEPDLLREPLRLLERSFLEPLRERDRLKIKVFRLNVLWQLK